MLKDIIFVNPIDNFRLWLRFEDGVEGEVDVTELVEFQGVFEPLKNPEFFIQVAVNPESGTVCWPNEADLDPDVLYAKVSGLPLPTFNEREWQPS